MFQKKRVPNSIGGDVSPQSRQRLTRYLFAPMLFVAAVGGIYIRQPAFFTAPRFWAEEGKVYFAYALSHPWYYVLLTPHPNFGYYSLLNNLAAVVAALVPLEYAPLLTTLFALSIQLIPIGIILWGRSALFEDLPRRVFVMLIMLFTLSTREIWLNTTNSQFYLLLVAALILAERIEQGGRFKVWVYRLLLILAGLSSPTMIVLAPCFFVKAWFEKRREYRIHAAIITGTSLIQIVAFFFAPNRSQIAAKRLSELDLPTFAHIIWSRTIVLPLAGLRHANDFADRSLSLQQADPQRFWIQGVLLLLLAIVLIAVLVWPVRDYRPVLLIAGAYCAVICFTIVTAITHDKKFVLIYPEWSPRYFYVPSVLLLLLIVSACRRGSGYFEHARAGICLLLTISAIVFGVISYRETVDFAPDWPNWQQEVARYRADPAYSELQIWPPGWSVKIGE